MTLVARLSVLLLAAASFVASAQGRGDALDQLVPAVKQRQLGLDKLSPQQRTGVRDLLLDAYQLGKNEVSKPPAVSRGRPIAPMPSAIETQIDGDFDGWEGETVVKLMNGQIWQQSDYTYEYHYAFMPNVLIYPSSGGYKMKVEGVSQAVTVIRLR